MCAKQCLSARRGFGERGGAESAASCRDRYFAEALGAFLSRRIGGRLSAPHSSEKQFIGSTMKKYTAAAIRMNEITALMKSPIRNLLPLIVNSIAEKSGFPTMAAMNGVIRSLTNAVTTAPNATPITTATARSRTLPRKINCLKPCNQHIDLPSANLDAFDFCVLRGGRRIHAEVPQPCCPASRYVPIFSDPKPAGGIRAQRLPLHASSRCLL